MGNGGIGVDNGQQLLITLDDTLHPLCDNSVEANKGSEHIFDFQRFFLITNERFGGRSCCVASFFRVAWPLFFSGPSAKSWLHVVVRKNARWVAYPSRIARGGQLA